MIFGSMSSRILSSQGRQARHSSGSGSRFSGGRHFTILVMNTFRFRESPTCSSIWSRSCPLRPTKGLPCSSSLRPGPSPTITIRELGTPAPNTAWVRPSHNPQFRHCCRSSCICRSMAVRDITCLLIKTMDSADQYSISRQEKSMDFPKKARFG